MMPLSRYSETPCAISIADAFLRLGGRGAEVRRQHDVGQRAERQIVRRRFLFVDVERRAADLAALAAPRAARPPRPGRRARS